MSTRLPEQARELVDLRFFAAIEDLGLVAHGVVEGFLHGLHRSPYVGFSVEFASHREYRAGDDLRHLNWKLYAKFDRLYIKQYDAETNLDCHIVLDVSGSMDASNAAMSKRKYASMLAAALAHLALKQRDAVGLTLFADKVLAHLKPRAKSTQLDEILRMIVTMQTRPAAPNLDALHEAASLMPRRGLVVLISDFLFPSEEIFSALDHFRFRGHDLLVLQVLDPIERAIPLDGMVRFHDLETSEELLTRAEEIGPAYAEAVEGWLGELESGCLGREIDRVVMTTDEPADRALVEYLGRRAHHY
jgi:uncharacterized protein (DUF58 family)